MSHTPRGDLQRAYPNPVKPRKLSHIVIRTARFADSVTWWRNVLDAAPAFENEQVCFMTYDEEHHRIGIINMPQLAEQIPGTAGMEHVAFTFDQLGELLATYKRLKAQNITPFWTINHGPTISFYYRDPDGNKVELQYDVFRSKADVDAFFASGAYEENFMGVVFQPETMVADYEAGVPLHELVTRPKLPPGTNPWDMLRE